MRLRPKRTARTNRSVGTDAERENGDDERKMTDRLSDNFLVDRRAVGYAVRGNGVRHSSAVAVSIVGQRERTNDPTGYDVTRKSFNVELAAVVVLLLQ